MIVIQELENAVKPREKYESYEDPNGTSEDKTK